MRIGRRRSTLFVLFLAAAVAAALGVELPVTAALAVPAPPVSVTKVGSYTVFVSEVTARPVAVNDKHTVLFLYGGALQNGSMVFATNAKPDKPDMVNYAVEWKDLNDSDTAVGQLADYSTQPATYQPMVWHIGTNNAATFLNLSGIGATNGTATVIDDAGEIAGSGGNGICFYMKTSAGPAQAVPSPTGSGTGCISAMNAAYELVTVGGQFGSYYLLDRATGKYQPITLNQGYSEFADRNLTTDGAVLDKYYDTTTRIVRPDGTARSVPWALEMADTGAAVAYNPGTYVAGVYQGGAANYYYTASGQKIDLNDVIGTDVGLDILIAHGGSGMYFVPRGTFKENQDVTYDAYVIGAGTNPPVVNSTADGGVSNAGKDGCTTGRTVTVNGTAAPECTLRAAIEAENAGTVSQKKITFALPTDGTNPGVITPGSPLPALKATGVTIDGAWNGATVHLNGTHTFSGSKALLEVSGGTDVVQNIALCQADSGILVDAPAGHDTVRAVSECTGGSDGGVSVGVLVRNSPSALIGGIHAADRNVIDQADQAVWIKGAKSAGAHVQGNWLGVTPDGTDSLHDFYGVVIEDASSVTIGGPTATPGAAPGNVLVGLDPKNADGPTGISVFGNAATVSSTVIQGNLIGPLPDGITLPTNGNDRATFYDGVQIAGRVTRATVGGSASTDRNVITGAVGSAVRLSGVDVNLTTVRNNYLGTDATGKPITAPQADTSSGVVIDAADNSTVSQNVITAHGSAGVVIGRTSTGVAFKPDGAQVTLPGTGATAKTTNATVSTNIVGPGADGSTVPTGPADQDGVTQRYGIVASGSGDTIGPDNQVSYNGVGIAIGGPGETVSGNLVGTDPTGISAIPNGIGVTVTKTGTTPATTRIGVPGQKQNVISGNLWGLVAASAATVQNNVVGTVANGLSALPAYPHPETLPSEITEAPPTPNSIGALVTLTGAGTVLGGTRPGFGNVISGGAYSGVVVTAGATVQGNDIGVGANGTTPVPNGTTGISVTSAAVIGAAAPGGKGTTLAPGGNVIADNKAAGVAVGKTATGVQILSNSIHDNTGGGVALTTGNGGIEAPVVSTAAQDGHGHTVALIATAPGATVQVYAAANCAVGAQGSAVLATGTADPSGNLSVPLPLQAVGAELDAVATGAHGSSAFSACTAVAPAATGDVHQTSGKPGDPDTADGSGFTPGEPVQASVHSAPVDLGTKPADGTGAVGFAFRLPTGLAAGQHYVVLTGQTSGTEVAIPLTVYVAPSAPRSLTARAGLHAVGLTWTSPVTTGGAPITSYRVQRSANGHSFATVHTVTGHSFRDTSVIGGDRYYYRVQAVNKAGASVTGNVAQATPYTAASAPRSVRAKPGVKRLTVTWAAPANAHGAPVTGYLVQYAACPIGARGCAVREVGVHGRSKALGLSPAHTWFVRVIAVNRAGRGAPSAQAHGRPLSK